jgi:hypothetical protein
MQINDPKTSSFCIYTCAISPFLSGFFIVSVEQAMRQLPWIKYRYSGVPVLDNWLLCLVWYTDDYRLSVNT